MEISYLKNNILVIPPEKEKKISKIDIEKIN